jgi:hypothetical protein
MESIAQDKAGGAVLKQIDLDDEDRSGQQPKARRVKKMGRDRTAR